MLDEADPALLRPCFERMETLLSEPAMRKAFGRLGGRTLVAWDGTQYHCSQKIGCPNCLTRERSNGRKENYHCLLSATVVAPSHSKVVPLMPEFVATRDGAEKQDCERNAAKRWFDSHHARIAPLRPVFLGDDLFACHPVCDMVRDAGEDFIFTCKPSSHKAPDCGRSSLRSYDDEEGSSRPSRGLASERVGFATKSSQPGASPR